MTDEYKNLYALRERYLKGERTLAALAAYVYINRQNLFYLDYFPVY
jgi:hypothetical protein